MKSQRKVKSNSRK